jgi:ankyrin repeat protein
MMTHRKDVVSDDNNLLNMAISDARLIEAILELIEKVPHAVCQPDTATGNFPLHMACMHSGLDVVSMKLIEIYPDAVQWKNKRGQYPLHIACHQCKSNDVVITLMRQFPPAVQEKDICGNYPFHLTCKDSSLDSAAMELMDLFPFALQHRIQIGVLPSPSESTCAGTEAEDVHYLVNCSQR